MRVCLAVDMGTRCGLPIVTGQTAGHGRNVRRTVFIASERRELVDAVGPGLYNL
jgi:hypothetical protein